MPIKIQVDAPIIRITFAGKATKAELIDAFSEMAKLEAESTLVLDRLTDLSGIVDRELDFQIILGGRQRTPGAGFSQQIQVGDLGSRAG